MKVHKELQPSDVNWIYEDPEACLLFAGEVTFTPGRDKFVKLGAGINFFLDIILDCIKNL